MLLQFDQFATKLSYSTPSLFPRNRKAGLSIGDDVCRILKNRVKAPFVGVPKSRKFKKGLNIAMYSNSCGMADWTETGRVHRERVCCSRGRFTQCQE